MATKLSYRDLLEVNNSMQNNGDETYFLCVTRTVQESKLFPVSSYMLLSYLNAYYRYPTLLRKIEAKMAPEMIADRVRNMASKIQAIGTGWCMLGFYLLGREMLINLGQVRPQDAAEDVHYVLDFWRRYSLAWHRNNGHVTNLEYGHRSQILPERRLQVYHSDLYPCTNGDELHTAAGKFIAAVSQYGFLVSCESRISLSNHGPYKIADNVELMVRDFFDLAEGDFPWLDGVAADVPFNNLTVTTAVKDTHFYLVDDWGSFESKPEYKGENIVGVGLYTSDALSEVPIPIGMGSRAELIRTFEQYAEIMREATNKLWKRFAGYTRNQMLDAGGLTYYSIIKDMAHIAGVYDADDWMKIDERAERFRGLLNDEYGNELLGHLLVPLTLPSAQVNEYTMMRHQNGPKRVYTPLSYALLAGEDHVPSVGGLRPGVTYLPPKVDRYRTTQGTLPLAEYNQRVQAFTPQLCTDKFRFLDETWVKYHYDTPLADEMYKIEQQHARRIKGKGAGLRRADIEALRD
ncbi:MAG TPA: hypothetical protein VJM11_14245 [Nevskiaceae bacterium]|nr:hypothetical protein [Nevskiaceae bacterium]